MRNRPHAAAPAVLAGLAGLAALAAALTALAARPARALVPEDGARTLSPYFHVAAGAGESFPLEETRTEAAVAGPIARVTVRQVFRNRGARPLEATYVFPASTRAAVHGLTMRVGARTVEARIARRGEAREAYAAARDGGRRAALLEEQRPNVFTMQVANVLPGERVEVALEYSELVVPEDGAYELVVPAVVGPRYGGGADPAADGWIASPYLREGEATPWRASFAARLESPLPLRDLGSPSHALDVRWRSPRSAEVSLREPGAGARDVVLRWRLAGDAILAGALVERDPDGEGGWFTAMVEPPARLPAATLDREYVFLVDVSGSMHGFPLDTAKRLLADLLARLGPSDLVNVVLFSGASEVLAPAGSLPATPANVARALALLARQQGGGGTELMEGLRSAYALPRAARPVSRSVVVVTDGYVGVEAEAFRFVRERLAEANLFSFGIGSAVNRHLVEGLARAGAGEPFVVLDAGHAPAAAERFRAYVERPLLAAVEARFEGADVRDVVPGRLPDLFARRPLVVSGRFRGQPRGRLVLTGATGEGPWRAEVELSAPAAGTADSGAGAGDPPVRLLWARAWVARLEDDHALQPAKELEEAITDLGLAHRLLTPFTSFVAVDSEVAHRGGRPDPVAQPLPLPDGVSDLAVGAGATQRFARLPATAAPAPAPASAGDARRLSKASAPEAARADELAAAPRREREVPAPALRASCQGAPAGQAEALAREVEARLAPLAARLPSPARLRLSFDAAGRLAGVTLPRGAARDLAEAVRRALAGLRCDGAPGRPLVVRVVVERR